MKYSNVNRPPDDDPGRNWFYMNKGEYLIMRAKRSEFSKVAHLEDITLQTTIALRIVIELLKRNVKKGLVRLTEQDSKKSPSWL
jgi:hypothetical protein